MAGESITRRLAGFVHGPQIPEMATPARERAKDILIDAVANALAGHEAEETEAILSFARGLGGSTESSVIGGGRLSPAGATIANSYLITAVTSCDVHRPTTCHVTPGVVGPALVAGEAEHASGAMVLDAVIAGLEVTTRVGLGLNPPTFRARNWHAPGNTGPFGAAAAVGRLLGLDVDRQTHAFGLAASQAAGTYVHLGTPTMKFNQSRGALGGMMAARLAKEGFTAAEDPLTDQRGGLFWTHSDGGTPDAVLAGLGEDWELTRISLRPWPVAVHLQPVVTGLMAVLAQAELPPARIREVRVAVSELAHRMHATVAWDERFRARLSTPFVAAVTIHDGRCGLDQFTDARIADAAVGAFARERVTVVADPQIKDGMAQVTITDLDGSAWTESVEASKGEPANPLSRDEIIEKFRTGGRSVLPGERVELALVLLQDLENVDDIGELMTALRHDDAVVRVA